MLANPKRSKDAPTPTVLLGLGSMGVLCARRWVGAGAEAEGQGHRARPFCGRGPGVRPNVRANPALPAEEQR